MEGVAASLAVSRATLYRVAHSRDALLADALWLLGDRVLDRARQRRTVGGVDGVLQVTREFVGQLHSAAPFRRFLAREPDTAARVLLHDVHRRAVAAQRDILREVKPWPPGELDQAAFLYVRVVESVLYAELLGGTPLDLGLAERAARSLLA
ncbi:QsdR family transcriptional regulator [Saccharothrix variisporea]|nr:QsdR family transcriptional regulator [Saccharothrix variisporea]